MISQCPNCKTRFVVGEKKLNIAGGSVRCGACMQVFSATDHQMTDHRQTSADTPKVEKPTTISNKDITEEPLNNSLPASDDSDHTTNLPDKNALKKTGEGIPQNDERIEPSIESIASFEVPPTIVAPPIEMDISEKPPLKNRLFGLIGVSFCLVLIFVLALHWLLAHPEQFKDHPRWRTTYQLACQLTPLLTATQRIAKTLIRHNYSELLARESLAIPNKKTVYYWKPLFSIRLSGHSPFLLLMCNSVI